jgi:hypothetical protein
MARHREPFGMKFSPEPPYEILESAALPEKDMKKLKNFARFWELIMNRNTVPGLFPAGEPVFWPFMELSGKLLARFGRNWGIDRRDLVNAVSDCLSAGLPEGGPVSIPLAAHTAG